MRGSFGHGLGHMKIMLITDAWDPQVNGVVTTMKRVIAETKALSKVKFGSECLDFF